MRFLAFVVSTRTRRKKRARSSNHQIRSLRPPYCGGPKLSLSLSTPIRQRLVKDKNWPQEIRPWERNYVRIKAGFSRFRCKAFEWTRDRRFEMGSSKSGHLTAKPAPAGSTSLQTEAKSARWFSPSPALWERASDTEPACAAPKATRPLMPTPD